MRNLAVALVFVAMLLGLVLSLVGNRDRSRFGISWAHAGTVAALSVPAGLIGEWLLASFALLVGLILIGTLTLLDRRERRKEQRNS